MQRVLIAHMSGECALHLFQEFAHRERKFRELESKPLWSLWRKFENSRNYSSTIVRRLTLIIALP